MAFTLLTKSDILVVAMVIRGGVGAYEVYVTHSRESASLAETVL
jgi:hypothetical protein